MTTPATIAGTDLDYIVRQIEEGAAAVDSWSRPAAGGYMRPDDAREYWAHLPVDPTTANSRAARVTVYRDAAGRWRIGDIDIYAGASRPQEPARRDDDAAAAILSAVEQDDRQIVRQGAAYIECA